MKAPCKKGRWWIPPNDEWLEHHYVTLLLGG